MRTSRQFGGRNRESLEIYLQAIIEHVWRYALAGYDRADLEAEIKRVWMCTGKQAMDSTLGTNTLFLSLLTRNRGNVIR